MRKKILFILAVSLLVLSAGCREKEPLAARATVDVPGAKDRHQADSSSGESLHAGQESSKNSQAKGTNPHRETAILAGGCFWGMEELLRAVSGVIDTEVGYTGGQVANPRYKDVKTGRSGHAESVQVLFDSTKISYRSLLRDHFFKIHDPTTVNRQGNDRGSQYRSVIFYMNDQQKAVAESVIAEINQNGSWGAPIVTRLEPAGEFTSAESEHQDYLQKHPGGYTCHYFREDLSF
ncbi:MAG: peptide-methionine (S)-S-oxide reductase MsrA [Polyangiaceae bacterium]|nr:peptide-methionine (S)-S-oxide reductase MsrA [Polyangiaceae bacterium]